LAETMVVARVATTVVAARVATTVAARVEAREA